MCTALSPAVTGIIIFGVLVLLVVIVFIIFVYCKWQNSKKHKLQLAHRYSNTLKKKEARTTVTQKQTKVNRLAKSQER